MLTKRYILHLSRAKGIARRYFVTNGFDGALTMLGLMMAFSMSEDAALPVAIQACFGAAIALGMSGMSSAYLSEAAERKKELQELEQALLTDLSASDHGKASRYLPIVVALVNGLSPLVISLIIITPLWLAEQGMNLGMQPFLFAMLVSIFVIFLLGIVLGRLSREFWLWTGLRTLAVAGLTILIIYFFNKY